MKTSDIREIAEKVGRDFGGYTVIEYVYDSNIIGYLITDANKFDKVSKIIEENVLMSLNVDKKVLEFLKTQTPEQIDRLKRLAQLEFHKKEVARLQSKIDADDLPF